MTPKAPTVSALRKEIVAALDLIFTVADEQHLSFKELAKLSDLSLSTIYRCWGCTFKRSPELLTVLKLAHAVDIPLTLNNFQ